MKILVTGATGFIGNHLIKELLNDKKHTIVATSRDLEKAKKFAWYKKVKYIQYDINSKNIDENLYDLFEKPDILIHLSWDGLSDFNNLIHIEENIYNNYNFIKNMVIHGLGDVTVIGTCLEYGMQSGQLSEDLITNPITSYGIAKDTLRKFIEQLQKKNEFDFKWIRLFYMYGEGQSQKSIIPQLEYALKNKETVFNMSKGEQLRDYLPIEIISLYIKSIACQKQIQGIINCCSGKAISIKNLLEQYLAKSHSKIKFNLGYYSYPDYEPMAFWGDNNKITNLILGKNKNES